MDKNKLNSIMTKVFLFTLLMSVVAGITTISNVESILGGGINTTIINANDIFINGSQLIDTNTFNSSADMEAVFYPVLSTYTNSSALNSYTTTANLYGLFGTYANTSSVSSLLSTYANTTALSSYQTITAGSSLLSTYLNSSTAGTTYQPLEATLTDIADGTIAEDLVNTANPWADNEVSDTLTASVLTDDNTYAKVSGETFTGDVVFNQNINVSTTSKKYWNSSIYEEINASGCLVRVVGTTRVNQCP